VENHCFDLHPCCNLSRSFFGAPRNKDYSIPCVSPRHSDKSSLYSMHTAIAVTCLVPFEVERDNCSGSTEHVFCELSKTESTNFLSIDSYNAVALYVDRSPCI
jgi:hypothetical protein